MIDNSMVIKKNNESLFNPKQFALWLGLASIVMLFGALTSAYMVRQSSGNWLEFGLPNLFYYSSIVIIISSITLHWSYIGFKKGNEISYKTGLIITCILGVVFIALQYYAWIALYQNGIELTGNPSGSFLYMITGTHAAHVIAGIGALFTALMHALSLKFEVTQKRIDRYRLVLHYWHFVDILWIYLFIFLLIQ